MHKIKGAEGSGAKKLVSSALILGLLASPASPALANFFHRQTGNASLRDKIRGGEGMVGPETQLFHPEEAAKKKVGMKLRPVESDTTFAAFDVLVKVQKEPKPTAKLWFTDQASFEKMRKERPNMASTEVEVMRKMERFLNVLLERYPQLVDAFDAAGKVLQVRLVNGAKFEGSSSGENVFGDTVYFSGSAMFSVNISRPLNDYDLASAVAFHVISNYLGGGFDTKEQLDSLGRFDIYFAPRLFARSFGTPGSNIDGESSFLLLAAFASAMGGDGFISAYLKGDTETARKMFDAKFGEGTFDRISDPPLNSWPVDEFLGIISARPDFASLKEGIKKAAALAGYTLDDSLFKVK